MTAWFLWGAFLAGAVAYVAASGLFFVQLTRSDRHVQGRSAPKWLVAAMAGHGAYITLASVQVGVCPVESVRFALSVAALVASGVYLLARRRWPIDVLGAFVAPVGLTLLLSTRAGDLGSGEPKFSPLFLTFHIAANLIGEALFLLSFVTAALYLFVEKRLKDKRPGSLFGRLPPLDALDQAEHRFLLIGFPLLTLGIVTGTAWTNHLVAGFVAGDPGQVLRASSACLTWTVFAAVLFLRAVAGWRGRRAALGTIVGFSFTVPVLLVYVVRAALVHT